MNGDDGFFALLGKDRDSQFAAMDIKNGIRRIALRKDDLICFVARDGFTLAALRKNSANIEPAIRLRVHQRRSNPYEYRYLKMSFVVSLT